MLIQGGFNWNTAVINTNNYELSKNPPIRQIYFVDDINNELTNTKIILPMPNSSEYSGKHIVFRRRSNTKNINFESYINVTVAVSVTITIVTGEIDNDDVYITDSNGIPITQTTTNGPIITPRTEIYLIDNIPATDTKTDTNTVIQSVDADGNPITPRKKTETTTRTITTYTSTSSGYIIDKGSNLSKDNISIPANEYVITFVCDGQNWYQIQ
jgi:hypothetical protein